MEMTEKTVTLDRDVDSDGRLKSFGFSVLGGHGMKYPAVVCEVDPGGPADVANVRIGDRLLALNGEDLSELSSKDLVQKLRGASKTSVFVMGEDESLRRQVLMLLKKQERRAAAKREKNAATSVSGDGVRVGGEGDVKGGGHKKVAGPSLSNASTGDEQRKKKKGKIIEVEPSVNINDGSSRDIYQVRANKIIGRVEQTLSDEKELSPTRSPGRRRRHSPSHGADLSGEERARTNSPRKEHRKQNLEQQTALSPGSAGSSAPRSMSGSLDSMSNQSTSSGNSQHAGGFLNSTPEHSVATPTLVVNEVCEDDSENIVEKGLLSNSNDDDDDTVKNGLNDSSEVVVKELNGEVKSLSEPSDAEVPTTDSDRHVVAPQDDIQPPASSPGSVDDQQPPSDEGPLREENVENKTLLIPEWNGPHSKRPRASLAENILVSELEARRPPDGQDQGEGLPPAEGRGDADTGEEKVHVVKKEGEVRTEESQEQHQRRGGSREREWTPTETMPPIPESPKVHSNLPDLDSATRIELMKKYRSTPTRTSSKRASDPYSEAVSLARRLYMLDGFKKSEVAAKLADPSDFGQTVAKEYLRFFEFERTSLDNCLRQFLFSFSLTGESQERERIMVHFSDRFFECNPDAFPTRDIVHGLTVAILLLNTDLHNDHGRQKMSFSAFSSNLGGIGVKLPRDTLKKYYESIRKKPLEWAIDEDVEDGNGSSDISADEPSDPDTVRTYHVTIPGTFVEVEMPGNAPLYKEGFVLRKNIMEGPHKKVSRGKRQWKKYYCYLKGFLLYFGQPQSELRLEDTSSAISVCHCLAMGAFDYHKKNSVLRITTSEWQSFLLQAGDTMDMQQWIGAINKAAARYSSPPLAAPISSSSGFQRPTFPLAPTRNSFDDQISSHDSKVKSLEKDLIEHQAYKPTGSKAKHNQLQNWFDKYEYLQFESNRFRIYFASLTSETIVDFNAPLPSGLVPSPSISTLATPGTGDDSELYRASLTPPHSPSRSRHAFGGGSGQKKPSSPLVTVKGKGIRHNHS